MHMSSGAIERFIEKKNAWINRKIAEVVARPRPAVKQFTDGEIFPYLGNDYPLKISDTADRVIKFDNGFHIPASCYIRARELLIDWYRSQASDVIKSRLDACASFNMISYERFKITSARTKWGSCSGRGRICFSWRLVMAPLDVIDYVVAHELAHIERKDHSKLFWDRVKELCPEYREHTRWLKDNGHLLAGII